MKSSGLNEAVLEAYFGPVVFNEIEAEEVVLNLLFEEEAEKEEPKKMGTDVRKQMLNKIYELLRGYARHHKSTLKNLDYDEDDFVQDVVVNIFRRKGLDNYDPAKISQGRGFEQLIFNIASRQVIDYHRKINAKSRLDDKGKPIRTTSKSLEEPVGHSKMADRELTRGEVTPGKGTGKSWSEVRDLIREKGLSLKGIKLSDLVALAREMKSRGGVEDKRKLKYVDYLMKKMRKRA